MKVTGKTIWLRRIGKGIHPLRGLVGVLLLGFVPEQQSPAITLIPAGASWAYLDNGSDQGTAWRNGSYNDSTWPVAPAQLGYGDNDEARVVGYGGNPNNKFITTYFRHSFTVADPMAFSDLTLSLLRDDGAVIYLNGREILRNNMPTGPIAYRTLAPNNIGGADENTFYPFSLAATNLAAGRNVLAVEIHQASTNSTDISFDLQLVGNSAPVTISPIRPVHNASGVNPDVSLSVALSSVASTNATVTIYGRPAGPSAGRDFTIIALPDTQYYVSSLYGGTPEMFTAQTDWIVSQKSGRNITFVTHLGDCVQNGDNGGNPIEWTYATNAMYRLENPVTTFAAAGIPYGVAVGNHDQTPAGIVDGSTRCYNQFFGEAHFAGRDYYGGHYGTNNNNHFELFSASGLDFVVIHLEYDPAQSTNVLQWANQVLAIHRERRAIVVSHSILSVNGSFSAQGQKIYDAVKNNPNLFLMLCGHDAGEAHRTDTFNGNTIHTVLSDYQGRTNGGSGFLRLLEFSPSNNVIRIKTYTPVFGQFETNAVSQFTLDYNMRSGGPFTAIGSFAGICSATNLTVSWPGVSSGATYEWCATVNDGVSIQTSPMWQFTTAVSPALATQAPPVFAGTVSFDRSTGNLALSWPATAGSVYQIVYRDDIAAGNWQAFSEEITAVTSLESRNLPIDPAVPSRFFALKFVR